MAKNEPIAVYAIVRAVLTLLTAFGVVEFTKADTETILTAVGAVYLGLEVIISAFQRSRVTPVSKFRGRP